MIEPTNISVDQHIAGKIRYYRQRAKFTLSQMAYLLEDISFQQLQKYESGANRVSSGRLYQIAQILSVPVASFFPKIDFGKSAHLSLSEENELHDLLQENPNAREIYQLVLTLMQIDNQSKRNEMLGICQNVLNSAVDSEEKK